MTKISSRSEHWYNVEKYLHHVGVFVTPGAQAKAEMLGDNLGENRICLSILK